MDTETLVDVQSEREGVNINRPMLERQRLMILVRLFQLLNGIFKFGKTCPWI